MIWDPQHKPCLRPLEAFRLPEGDGAPVGVRDRTCLSDVVLSVSEPALHIMALMDGTHTCEEIREQFESAFGQVVSTETLRSMVEQLEQAHFLEGSAFEAFYQAQLDAYRAVGVREMRNADALGVVDGSGDLFKDMLGDGDSESNVTLAGDVVGLVAPHLDYPRGKPCYAAAYATLRDRPAPDCVVILGTNHFGRSTSVVATASDFATPLGITRSDSGLIQALEDRCGDLREYELDHALEHSIELQVAWLQYLFGADSFQLAAFLCPDPCGPTGTAPFDGHGVDLRAFSIALGDLVAQEDRDILVVAGADLSHIGPAFGDDRDLDDAMLEEARRRDHDALAKFEANDPDAFVRSVAERDNPTQMCSVGCMFALRTALPQTSGTVIRYHQAVDHATGTCVTCAAVALC